MKANVIGAGLAGCEAAWQLASRGVDVTLYEMKPARHSPAHNSDNFAELVCSNSLRADGLANAVGLLKTEMRRLDSLIMMAADATAVPAGGALAVDREAFSAMITEKIRNHPRITVVEQEVTEIPDGPTVVASGPLTSEALSRAIGQKLGKDYLYFFDAAAPIVTAESIDMNVAFFASRYDKGTPDYINCPMDKEQYTRFYKELITAKQAHLHDFDRDQKVFEGCMPVEVMAKRGEQTLLFGPLKPVGLVDSRTGKRSYAVVQLRKDNAQGSLYNIVGFQTHLTFGEQKRVFSMIPGLENAEFVRYGVMHRNTYIHSPGLMTPFYSLKSQRDLFFAGKMTGVEGYVESAASGLVAGLNLARRLQNKEEILFPKETALGALAQYVSDDTVANFQPMNINFGIITSLDQRIKNKQERYTAISMRALAALEEYIASYGIKEDVK